MLPYLFYNVEQTLVEQIPDKLYGAHLVYVGLREVGKVISAGLDGLFDPDLVLVNREAAYDVGGVLQVVGR